MILVDASQISSKQDAFLRDTHRHVAYGWSGRTSGRRSFCATGTSMSPSAVRAAAERAGPCGRRQRSWGASIQGSRC